MCEGECGCDSSYEIVAAALSPACALLWGDHHLTEELEVLAERIDWSEQSMERSVRADAASLIVASWSSGSLMP